MKWRELNSSYRSRIEQLEKMSPYELLGVNEHSTKKEVRAAYLRKLKIHHPDKNQEFMKKYSNKYSLIINNAYEKLMRALS